MSGRAEQFFSALDAGFARATTARRVVPRYVTAGSATARFEFAGDGLLAALGAGLLSRARDTAHPPAFTARLWDSRTTGVPPPDLPEFDRAGPDSLERVDTLIGGRFRASYAAAFGLAAAWDAETRTAVAWAASPDAVPPWETAAPLRTVWAWWADLDGGTLAHGAAVGDDRGGVLLAARGGSGKSTTALACLGAGMRFAGDDYVLIQSAGDGAEICGLFTSVKIDDRHLRTCLPSWESLALPSVPGYSKRVLILRGEQRAAFAERMPLRAIVVPRVAEDGRVALRRARGADVLRALGPTSVLQIPGAGPAAFARLAAIAARVPAFSLDVGPDLDAVVAAVHEALAIVAGTAAA